MSRLTKFSVAAFFLAMVLCASVAQAMDIEMFDHLSPQDQQDYVKFLVRNVQTVLVEQGQPEPAGKVAELFRKLPGRDQSAGETQFEEGLAKRRSFERDTYSFRFTPFVGQVEDALIQVLANNRINFPVRVGRDLKELLRAKPFWPKRPLRT